MRNSFPTENDFDEIRAGLQDFAERWGRSWPLPARGRPLGLRCTRRRLRMTSSRRQRPSLAIDRRPDSASTSTEPLSRTSSSIPRPFVENSPTGISTVTSKDSRIPRRQQEHPREPSHFGEVERGWDFVSPARRRRLESLFRALNRIGLGRPALDRVGGLGHGPRLGSPGRAAFVRRTEIRAPSAIAFDAAMQR